jgi:hypothetical protein
LDQEISAIQNHETKTEQAPEYARDVRDLEDHESLQSIYESNKEFRALEPEDFESSRKWSYLCRICDGRTDLTTKHPYCRHCGFSARSSKP